MVTNQLQNYQRHKTTTKENKNVYTELLDMKDYYKLIFSKTTTKRHQSL